jgi:uncharacterized membrane protein YvlD (DUF360 family)
MPGPTPIPEWLHLLTAFVVPGFSVRGFWSAVGGALSVSLVSWALNAGLKDRRGSRR